MKATVSWLQDELFIGRSESGHIMAMDADGGNTAPTPLENVLLSLGGCSSVDVVSILNKAKQKITGCQVNIEAKRVEQVPKVFSDIHLNFVITGHDINEKHVARAVSLSADKYCSVAKMLESSVSITHDFTIKVALS
jgi:putative redox protein